MLCGAVLCMDRLLKTDIASARIQIAAKLLTTSFGRVPVSALFRIWQSSPTMRPRCVETVGALLDLYLVYLQLRYSVSV